MYRAALCFGQRLLALCQSDTHPAHGPALWAGTALDHLTIADTLATQAEKAILAARQAETWERQRVDVPEFLKCRNC